MAFCPFNCKKHRAAQENIEKLLRSKKLLEQDSKDLQFIIQLSQEYQILGVEKREDKYGTKETLVAVITRAAEGAYLDTRTLYLFKLPYIKKEQRVSIMDIFLLPNCRVHLENWCALQIPGISERPKYGGRLMRYLLAFLRTAGFRTLTATISPTDYDHLEDLLAIYSRFGFEITDRDRKKGIFLRKDLFEKRNWKITKDGCIICCRATNTERSKGQPTAPTDSAMSQ